MLNITQDVNDERIILNPCSESILSDDEKARLLNLENRIKKKIIGQDEIVASVCRAIRRSRVGFKDANRPVGSFMFLGASGNGKTELCKVLAEVLYGSHKNLIKLDMSEFLTKFDASKLLGAAPGYIGFDSKPHLISMINENPNSILCVDEIEKACSEVHNIFLQIMEDGVLTSSQGEIISFANVVIIFTSNIGADIINGDNKPIGFSRKYNEKTNITSALKKAFRPEFINRLTETFVFNRLTEKDILQICKIMLRQVKLKAHKLNIKIDFEKNVVTELASLGYSPEHGARELRRVIETEIEDMLADKVLTGEIASGDNIRITFNKDCFAAEKLKPVKIIEKSAQYE